MRVPVRLPAGWAASLREVLPARVADRPIAALGAGLDCWAVQVGDDMVVRIPQNADGAAAVERDGLLLPELASVVPVPIPAPLFTVANPFGPGLVGAYRLVPGEVLGLDEWHGRGLLDDANAATTARIIESISSFPVARAAELGVGPGDGRADFVADLTRIRAEVAPLLEPSVATELIDWWEWYVADDAHFAYEPTVIHADLSLDHLLVTDGRVSGVIDFGDIAIGDPDAELLYLWAEAGSDFVARVQRERSRPLTPQLSAKLEFLAMTDELSDVLWGLDHDRPEIARGAIEALRSTLDRAPGQ